MVETISLGVILFFIGYFGKVIFDGVRNRIKEKADKKAVYNWLKNNTEDKSDFRFKSLFEIAKGTGLSEEKVKHICTIHKEIKQHKNEFGIYEWNSVYEERGMLTL